MKHLEIYITLHQFFSLGGTLQKGDELLFVPKSCNVIFESDFYSAHNDHLIHFSKDGKELDAPCTVGDFKIKTDLVLKKDVEQLIKDAYNMGAFSGNAMARTLHKEIECLSLEQFLERHL